MAESLPSNANLLLVDDEENILRSLKRILRKEPYDIRTATSGEDALALLNEQKFDLVISDARMPGMDGPTLLAEIKKTWPWCIRILLTGSAAFDSRLLSQSYAYD